MKGHPPHPFIPVDVPGSEPMIAPDPPIDFESLHGVPCVCIMSADGHPAPDMMSMYRTFDVMPVSLARLHHPGYGWHRVLCILGSPMDGLDLF